MIVLNIKCKNHEEMAKFRDRMCEALVGCVLYIQHKIAKTMEADERKCRNEKHV